MLKSKQHTADCIIAAIAMSANYPLVTANVKDFEGLHPDLEIIPFTPFSKYRQQAGKPVQGLDEMS